MKQATSSNRIAAQLFLRGLGLVYALAFYSFYTQMEGLVGPRGILPLDQVLEHLRQAKASFLQFPSLSLYFPNWTFFRGLVLVGMLLGLVAATFPRSALIYFLLWLGYLSVCLNGQTFMSFQWDNLLLECGFLSVFLVLSRNSQKLFKIMSFLFIFLLFKLMFSSGIVKFTFGDPSWLEGKALDYHFWTQPLPTRLAWDFDHAPQSLRFLLCYFTYFVELFVPFLYFFGPRLRLFSFFLNFSLMFGIFLTGNYNFFNILTVLISLFLINDHYLLNRPSQISSKSPSSIKYVTIYSVLILFVSISSIQIFEAFRPQSKTPTWIQTIQAQFSPFRSINPYGLFRVMTKERREIELQASDSPLIESSWRSYEFQAKPGSLERKPVWIQPLHPRLDWQLWFAALSEPQREPWYMNFVVRLLQAEPAVLGLLHRDPLAGRRPKYIRAQFWDYRFSSHAERNEKGLWWQRKYLGLYHAPIYLR